MSLRKLAVVVVLSMFLGSVAVAQTGQRPSPSQPLGGPLLSVPPDTSGVKAAPKPYSSSNTINNNARRLIPDGSWEQDYVDNTNTQAWFSFPFYYEHTYMIEESVPYSYNNQAVTCLENGVFETDGTTAVPTTDQTSNPPNLNENGWACGRRTMTYNFSGGDRFIHVAVGACCGNTPPPAGLYFNIRVIDLTQVAARWTVNGYNMYIALNNTSRGEVHGYVDYYDQAGNFVYFDSFDLAPDGSTQIVHNANVALGGAIFGGIRVIPYEGSPGAITAHEYNFNTNVGQYLTFPFNPAPWRYGTPQQ